MILNVFDLETTGLDRTKDQIIQFAGIKINTDTHEILETIDEYIKPVGNYSIAIAAYFKHHITAQFLSDKPTMHEVGAKIEKFFEGIDNILTFNGNGFDIPFLKNELQKYGYNVDFESKNCYDAFLEEKRRNGNTLEDTYKRYKGKSMEEAGLSAHNALSDIKATYSVFIAQQNIKSYEPEKMYGEDNVIKDMEFCGELKPCVSIGKYRGVSLEWIAEHDQNYIRWCVSDKCNFMESTKNYIKKYLK